LASPLRGQIEDRVKRDDTAPGLTARGFSFHLPALNPFAPVDQVRSHAEHEGSSLLHSQEANMTKHPGGTGVYKGDEIGV